MGCCVDLLNDGVSSKVDMWYDQTKSVLSFLHNLKLHYISFICWKPQQNWTYTSRDMSKCRFWKTVGKIEVVSFDGL